MHISYSTQHLRQSLCAQRHSIVKPNYSFNFSIQTPIYLNRVPESRRISRDRRSHWHERAEYLEEQKKDEGMRGSRLSDIKIKELAAIFSLMKLYDDHTAACSTNHGEVWCV